MPRVALTDRFCSTAKPLGTRTDYFDAKVPGLALRVTENGHRSWSYLVHLAPRRQASAGHDRELSGHEPRSGSW